MCVCVCVYRLTNLPTEAPAKPREIFKQREETQHWGKWEGCLSSSSCDNWAVVKNAIRRFGSLLKGDAWKRQLSKHNNWHFWCQNKHSKTTLKNMVDVDTTSTPVLANFWISLILGCVQQARGLLYSLQCSITFLSAFNWVFYSFHDVCDFPCDVVLSVEWKADWQILTVRKNC